MKLKDSELKSILAEVETEIESLLKSEGDALKKAKDDGAPDEGGSESGPAEEAPAEASAPDAAPAEGSAPPEVSGSPEAGSPPPEASASPEMSAPAGDPAADQALDPAALQAEYSTLSPEELKAHYMACKAALFAVMGAGGGGSPEGSAPVGAPPPGAPPAGPEMSASPAGPPPGAPPAGPEMSPPPPAFKAEVPSTMTKVPANGALKPQAAAVPDAIKKSEQDSKIESLTAKLDDQNAQIDLMAKALDLALGTPVRKAVTGVAFLPKTESAPETKELNKSEIKEKITSLVRGGKLKKNDAEKLVSYSLGNLGFDQIKHLLEK